MPRPAPSICTGQGRGGQRARSAQSTLQAQAQAEAMLGARGFQGTSGGAPCVLTTVTTPAHSETPHKAPPRQRSHLINTLHHSEDGHAVSFQTHNKTVGGCGWARAPEPTLCAVVPSAKGAWALLLSLLSRQIPPNQPDVQLLGDTHSDLLGPT